MARTIERKATKPQQKAKARKAAIKATQMFLREQNTAIAKCNNVHAEQHHTAYIADELSVIEQIAPPASASSAPLAESTIMALDIEGQWATIESQAEEDLYAFLSIAEQSSVEAVILPAQATTSDDEQLQSQADLFQLAKDTVNAISADGNWSMLESKAQEGLFKYLSSLVPAAAADLKDIDFQDSMHDSTPCPLEAKRRSTAVDSSVSLSKTTSTEAVDSASYVSDECLDISHEAIVESRLESSCESLVENKNVAAAPLAHFPDLDEFPGLTTLPAQVQRATPAPILSFSKMVKTHQPNVCAHISLFPLAYKPHQPRTTTSRTPRMRQWSSSSSFSSLRVIREIYVENSMPATCLITVHLNLD